MSVYKLSTAANVPIFMSSITNILGGVNSISSVNLSKNGGAFASISPTITSMGIAGHYWLSLSAANLNTLGDFVIEATGLLSVGRVWNQVVAYDPADAAGLGLSRIDVAISTRMATFSYVAADNAGIAAIQAKTDAFLDATVSSRSTYAGADTAGTTTLLGRITTTRAGLLDNLDVAISTRLALVAYTAPDNASVSAILTRTDVPTSTRLASSAYAAPDNATISAVYARTDVATSTRLAQIDYAAPFNVDIMAIEAKVDVMQSNISTMAENIPTGMIFVQGKRYGSFVK